MSDIGASAWGGRDFSMASLAFGKLPLAILRAVGTRIEKGDPALFTRKLTALFIAALTLPAYAAPERSQTEDVVVTGTRYEERQQDIVIAVDVISREQLEDASGRSVPELLMQQPGISVRDFFGNYSSSSVIDLRGFGASAGPNTALLLDGRRIRDIDFSGVQWPAFALDSLERIEILRGGGAVLYGDGAVGGVVNLITRTPFERPEGASARVEKGSYGATSAAVSSNIHADEVGLSLHAGRSESDGYRQNNENRVSNAGAVIEWKPERWHAILGAGLDQQDLRLPGARAVDPSLGRNELNGDRRGTSKPKDYSTHDGQYVNLELTGDNDAAKPSLTLGYRGKRETSSFDFGGFPDYRQIDLSSVNLSPRVRFNWGNASAYHSLIFGADYYHWNYRLLRSNAAANIDQPVNSVAANQENLALYVFYSWRLSADDLISTGQRIEKQHVAATDHFDSTSPGAAFGSGAPSGTQSLREYAEELGWRHEFTPTLGATARYARAYRFATVDEIYESGPTFNNEFQFLRPQTSRGFDLRLEYHRAAIRSKLGLFALELRDEIHLDPFFTGIGNTNLPRSRRRGSEWEGQWAVSSEDQLTAGYTYTSARFLEGSLSGTELAGREVPLVARHLANLGWTHRWGAYARTGLQGRYVGTRRMDNDEGNTFSERIPSYTLLDAFFAWQQSAWTLRFAVNNLTNRKYYEYAVASTSTPGKYNAYPLPERALFFSATYHFEK